MKIPSGRLCVCIISVISGAQEGGEVKIRITYVKTVRWELKPYEWAKSLGKSWS